MRRRDHPDRAPAVTLDYHVVDVFTAQPFGGNPLAVVFGADELSTAQLQALAREFNLSETVFPMPSTTPEADYRLRIFTPGSEIPFAGHPSVGAAWVMHALGRVGAGRVVQECGAGLLPLDVGPNRVVLTGGEPVVGEPVDTATVLAAVGLEPADAVGTPARWCSTGLVFAFLHVHDDAMTRAAPDLTALARLGNAGVSVFSYEAGRAHVRVFAAGVGVPEDPATGSAGLALGVWLVDAGLLPGDGESSYLIEQGLEMGRPSRLECTVVAEGGRAQTCRVAGSVVPVAQGRIEVPPA